MVKILVQHAAKVFDALPAEQESSKRKNKKQLFLEALPSEFSRQVYVTVAKTLEIPDKTAENTLQNSNKTVLSTIFRTAIIKSVNAKMQYLQAFTRIFL